MIILDTNLISEPLRPDPEPCVVAWIDAQPFKAAGVKVIDPWQ